MGGAPTPNGTSWLVSFQTVKGAKSQPFPFSGPLDFRLGVLRLLVSGCFRPPFWCFVGLLFIRSSDAGAFFGCEPLACQVKGVRPARAAMHGLLE